MMENNEYIVYRVSQQVLDGKLLLEISKNCQIEGGFALLFHCFFVF